LIETEALEAAAVWVALHLLLLLVLSGLVVRQRRGHRVAIGDGGVPQLNRAARVFGNAAEYVPAFLAGLILLALIDAPAGVVHGLGALMLAGRTAHAVGLTRSEGPTGPRTVGMVLTWLSYLLTAGALLFYAL
jgi:uncharacterized membrane protein YecN with MAPEG domain